MTSARPSLATAAAEKVVPMSTPMWYVTGTGWYRAALAGSLEGMAEIDDLLADVASACEESGRHDLAERLEARARLLARPSVCVVVAGEFKTGKSSLVNALVGEEVCPVDDHLA